MRDSCQGNPLLTTTIDPGIYLYPVYLTISKTDQDDQPKGRRRGQGQKGDPDLAQPAHTENLEPS